MSETTDVATVDDYEGAEVRAVIDLRTDPDRHMILVEGDIDITTAPRLHERLTTAVHSDVDEVVVDLRDVSFIDSTGLGVLVNGRQRARTAGTRLKLMLPDGQARFPFEVTGLASMFDTHVPDPILDAD